MTLSSPLRTDFGKFNIEFEAENTIHTYRIKVYGELTGFASIFLPADVLVTFTDRSGRWDLPSPHLLKVQAAIGKFLHMSGEAEVIEKCLNDLKDCDGLVPGGSTNVEKLLEISSLSLLLFNRMDHASSSAIDNRK